MCSIENSGCNRMLVTGNKEKKIQKVKHVNTCQPNVNSKGEAVKVNHACRR